MYEKILNKYAVNQLGYVVDDVELRDGWDGSDPVRPMSRG